MAIIIEIKKRVLNFDKSKPTVYTVAPVRMQKVTFDQLLKETSESCGVNRPQVKSVIEALISRISHFMEYGMSVQLGDFGTFKPTINSKAQDSPDTVGTDNVVRRKIIFYPGKRFKEMLRDVSVMSFSDLDGDGTGTEETPGGGTGENPGGGDFE